MFKLVIQDDEGKTTVVPLSRDEITIGRKEGNTIRLTERNVSRRHARILRANGEVTIEDLGSYNGIRVNNARIAERVQLRVSDQVQIGDYKLFLKAEGLEHVDDAKTVPIERVDTATSIDAVPVEAPVPAPVVVVPTVAGALPPGGQLVGHPNHTLVSLADTDPSGRPIATPGVHGAILQPQVGHARLVVLSSNFAGSEFELSRPQMIIGRTDENDIVINHRSISRNHAKIVRDPDGGRYTISDLQSSNGVRVNGQDYGKVELRRGDVIDLGHVRMRFVDAGEEYVFSHDLIEDVPEEGRGRGMWIAIALAALVLGGVGLYMAFGRNTGSGGGGPGPGPGPGPNTVAVVPDATTPAVENDAAVVAMAPDAAAAPQVQLDAAVASPPDATAVAVPDDPLGLKLSECKMHSGNENWAELRKCIGELRALKAPAAEIDPLTKQVTLESRAKVQYDQFVAASKRDDMRAMAAAVRAIPDESGYSAKMKAQWNPIRDKFVRAKESAADAAARAGRCGELRTLAAQVQPYDRRASDQIAQKSCTQAKRVCAEADAAEADQQLEFARRNYDLRPDEVIQVAENAVGARSPCVSPSGDAAAKNRYGQFLFMGLLAACKAERQGKADFFQSLRGAANIPAGCQKFLGDASN